MRSFISRLALFGASAVCVVGAAACTADVHDNTFDVHDNNANIDDAKVEFETDTDVTNVQASQSVHVVIVAEDVFLVEPTDTPPSDRVNVAGHFQFYFDDMSSEPILVTAQKSVDVMIPAGTAPGQHKLICRVHKHDGTPTQATFELDVTVKATVSG
jgi:plastocyanin